MGTRPCSLFFPLLLVSCIHLQAQQAPLIPVDHKGEPVSSAIALFENHGQFADVDGVPREDILFQSWQANPKVCLLEDNTIAFLITKIDLDTSTVDTIVRIDYAHIGELVNTAAVAEAFEQIPDFHNYFLPHCPNGILNVPGYKRVVYRDIYPGIDFHVYSNPWGLKFYYVINPGADPSNILLKFTGQDSLGVDPWGALKIYFQDRFLRLPNAIAYQQIGLTTTQVPWGLNYQQYGGAGAVGFNFGAFDPNHPLVVDISQSMPPPPPSSNIPEWSSYDGDADQERCEEIVTFGNNQMAACGQTFSMAFPLEAGATDGIFSGLSEAYVSIFNDQYSRIYTSFVGGDGYDAATSLAIGSSDQFLYLLGQTESSIATLPTVWSGSQYFDDTHASGATECFIAQFEVVGGALTYCTRFGQDETWAGKIRLDKDDAVYICGRVNDLFGTTFVPQLTCGGTNNTFPLCNTLGAAAYFQDFHAGGNNAPSFSDVFFAKFNPDLTLALSTLFGGHGEDWAADLVVDDQLDRVFLTGETLSPRESYTNCEEPLPGFLGFPLCDPGSGYFQDDLNGNNTIGNGDVFMACIGFNGQLLWSTFVGSAEPDFAKAMCLQPAAGVAPGRVYVVGGSYSNLYGANCSVPSNGGFPLCAVGGQFSSASLGGEEGFIMYFDKATFALGWSSFISGGADDRCMDVTIDENGNVFVGGYTLSGCNGTAEIPILDEQDHYKQEDHADDGQPFCQNDGMVIGFDPANGLYYGSYWGGEGTEAVTGISVVETGTRLYISGNSFTNAGYPFFCPATVNPYCVTYPAWSYTDEIFYAQVQYDLTTTVSEGAGVQLAGLTLFPNPTQGDATVWISGFEREGPLQLDVFNLLGSCCLRDDLAPGTVRGALPTALLANGLYRIRVSASHSGRSAFGNLLLQR